MGEMGDNEGQSICGPNSISQSKLAMIHWSITQKENFTAFDGSAYYELYEEPPKREWGVSCFILFWGSTFERWA